MQCHANSLARIESDWTFRDGDKSLITSISCTKQSNLVLHFHVIEKCKTKFDCLVHEMLVIRDLSPSLNVQSDSIRAKLFA